MAIFPKSHYFVPLSGAGEGVWGQERAAGRNFEQHTLGWVVGRVFRALPILHFPAAIITIIIRGLTLWSACAPLTSIMTTSELNLNRIENDLVDV